MEETPVDVLLTDLVIFSKPDTLVKPLGSS